MNNNYEDAVFQFGAEEEQSDNKFNYDSLSGLGESNYENEDLFNVEVSNPVDSENNNIVDNYNINPQDEVSNFEYTADLYDKNNMIDDIKDFKLDNNSENIDNTQISINEPVLEFNEPEVTEEISIPKEEIKISDTSIEDLNELTHYEEDKIESTDIKALFDKVSLNVKDASDIFRKNSEMKEKIDIRFEELKKLQSEVESSKNKQIDEINKYKEEVLNKLTDKKEEIEKRLKILKDLQASLEKEKNEFEIYKKEQQEKIDSVQKEVQAAYDERRIELGNIEDSLRKQKDALDEERNQLSLDKIKYESDKNDLANSLLKFNELVDSFTTGVNDINN